jgi:hypothetical protein
MHSLRLRLATAAAESSFSHCRTSAARKAMLATSQAAVELRECLAVTLAESREELLFRAGGKRQGGIQDFAGLAHPSCFRMRRSSGTLFDAGGGSVEEWGTLARR